jgi:hypothetical protein
MMTGLMWIDYSQGADCCGNGNEPPVFSNGKKQFSLLAKRFWSFGKWLPLFGVI